MIRYIALIQLLLISVVLTAQDDYYYDPNNDETIKTSTESAYSSSSSSSVSSNPEQYSPADRTDGYSNADTYTSRDGNGNTTINNYFYEDDDFDNFVYTTRVRRYYGNSWGADYYSYVFTPSYYYGWNNWNNGFYNTYNPWHANTWWRWNRHGWQNTVVYYDPWYDPYWSYNWGWNTFGFYNISFFPTYSYCGTPYVWNTWGGGRGCNAGWGNNGWCGNGWNNGYYNGYNQGYWNGYQDGYNNGYWNSPYAYGNGWGGWNGPYFNQQPSVNNNKLDVQPVTNTHKPVPTASQIDLGIPKEGVVKPFNPDGNNPVKSNVNSDKPVTEFPGNVNSNMGTTNGKPAVNQPSGVINSNASKYDSKTDIPVIVAQPGVGPGKLSPTVTPAPQNNSGGKTAPNNVYEQPNKVDWTQPSAKPVQQPYNNKNVQIYEQPNSGYNNKLNAQPSNSGGKSAPNNVHEQPGKDWIQQSPKAIQQPYNNKGVQMNDQPNPGYNNKPNVQPSAPPVVKPSEKPVYQQPKSNYQEPVRQNTAPVSPENSRPSRGGYTPKSYNENSGPGNYSQPSQGGQYNMPNRTRDVSPAPQRNYNASPSPQRSVSPQQGNPRSKF
jgi:hypothetical protein